MYTDDLVVIDEIEDNLIKRLSDWKNNVENRGMRVNMNKNQCYNKWRTAEANAEADVVSVVEVVQKDC